MIGWQDVRTAAWCRDRTGPVDDELVRGRTGLRIDAMFSAPKIGWLLRESASGWPPADVCVGTVDSWLIWRLTGGERHVTEAGNASRTLLYDIVDLAWSPALLELFGVPAAVLPEVLRSDGDFGVCRSVPGLPRRLADHRGAGGLARRPVRARLHRRSARPRRRTAPARR